jgi:protein-disulfide isomerase
MNSHLNVFTYSSSRSIAFAACATLASVAVPAFAQTKAPPVQKAQTAAPSAPPAGASKPAVQAPAAGPASGAEQKYKTNVKGPAGAPIRVVEFADFMCPGCQQASIALRGYFAQQGDDISLTFKNFPLEQACNPGVSRTVHNGSCELALGAICASELGVFWPYHDRIFSRSWEQASRQDVIDNGVAVGMNKAKLEACLASSEAKSKLALQVKEGFEVNVQSTPTLVVNGRKLSATNQFASAVEEERKKLAATPAK